MKKTSFIFQSFYKKYFKSVFQLLILGYLIFQIHQIGFKNFLVSIPLDPLFYIIYLMIYISLPMLEYIIYKKKWVLSDWSFIKTLFKKKVLNSDVVGYSGEFFLYIWAKENLKIKKRNIIFFIKDNNIISSLSSGFVSFLLLLYFIINGFINIEYFNLIKDRKTVLLFFTITIFLIIILTRFKKFIFYVKLLEGIQIFLLHSVRILAINILQIFQWSLVMPEITLSVWFTYSAVQIIISRIPFLPSLDALFVNVILELSDLLLVGQDLIIGMLTMNIVFNRLLNLGIYAINFYQENFKHEDTQL